MYIAKDKNDMRIYAIHAHKGEDYFCPICGGKVVLRNGEVNEVHFAHEKNECLDDWHYDMSEWHRKMQEFFPEENRECVITYGNKKHRADVAINRTVIEMQHSPINAEEFADRNDFFKAAGYRVVWIFDVRDKVECAQIDYLVDDDYKFMWKNPMRIFQTIDYKLTDYDSRFSLYLDMYGEDRDCFDETKMYRINKVVWTRGSNNNQVDMSRFCISKRNVNLYNLESEEDFFISASKWGERSTNEMVSGLKKREIPWTTKLIGIKGGRSEQYVCPRKGNDGRSWTQKNFGLDLSGEGACTYCRYCAHIVRSTQNRKHCEEIICCFPTQVREIDPNSHPGYECSYAPTLWK